MTVRKSHSAEWKERRRWRALELKRDGWTHEEVAEALGVTKGVVSRSMKRVAAQGDAGLRARPHAGAAPKLTAEQRARLPEFLSHGAQAYGFLGELWTCQRVAGLIRREFNVSYHKDHVGRLLKQLRWTPQKPMERAAQRDEEQIARWRGEIWPALKKKRPASGGRRSLLMKRLSTCCPGSSALTPRAARPRSCAGS